ncbi:hypothetical protein [Clostridium botulinum]|uniref:hypothetical protein n=1 Tax=Clostridium botulinum TaxID=1491 RepID=UPI0022462D05|nr:hypothetical protein [Clostridium botulinum]
MNFLHISEFKEYEDLKDDTEVVAADNKITQLTDTLFKNVSHECGILLDDLQSAECDYWCMVARYYFKMGVIAGATNLNFTNTLI